MLLYKKLKYFTIALTMKKLKDFRKPIRILYLEAKNKVDHITCGGMFAIQCLFNVDDRNISKSPYLQKKKIYLTQDF